MTPTNKLLQKTRENLKQAIKRECSYHSTEPTIYKLQDLLEQALSHIEILEAETRKATS